MTRAGRTTFSPSNLPSPTSSASPLLLPFYHIILASLFSSSHSNHFLTYSINPPSPPDESDHGFPIFSAPTTTPIISHTLILNHHISPPSPASSQSPSLPCHHQQAFNLPLLFFLPLASSSPSFFPSQKPIIRSSFFTRRCE